MSDSYTLKFNDRALSSLKNIDKAIAQRILRKLEWLAANTTVIPHTALAGNWEGFYRLRVGDYRVIYRLNHDSLLIAVEVIGHRREIYTK